MPELDGGANVASTWRRVAADPASFHECVEKYGGLVWSLARRFSNHADAEDAVQEIFLDLWQKAERWDREKSSEVTFVTMLARRKLIDRFRKNSRSIESSREETNVDLVTSSTASTAEMLTKVQKRPHWCLGSWVRNNEK